MSVSRVGFGHQQDVDADIVAWWLRIGLAGEVTRPPPCPSPPLAWRVLRLHHKVPGIQPQASAAGRLAQSGRKAEPCNARRA